MGKPIPVEDLVIPPQDTRICGTICLCQMIAVLSTVALVYLTVAIYVPSLAAFKSGYSETPVMCTTMRSVFREACAWVSCGEWCLSKSSGACTQIYVNARRNGSDLIIANCTTVANKVCYGIDQENAKKYKCIADECKNLTGTFNCTMGLCWNITAAFECEFKRTDQPLKCSGRRGKITCIEIDGLQHCNRGSCERILTPYNCDRRCVDIPTWNKNVILLSGDQAFLGQCQRVLDGTTKKEVWSENHNSTFMASCYKVFNDSTGVTATDCINGSLIDKSLISKKSNFTYLIYLSIWGGTQLDPTNETAPPETHLIVANDSRLLINMEGCVNTLRDECKDFLREFGKDGTDHNARARFPCFFSENDPTTIVTRFDLEKTYREFIVASLLPSILFVVSCLTLILCQRTVVVGDDAKMRFKCLAGTQIVPPNGQGSLASLGNDGSPMAL